MKRREFITLVGGTALVWPLGTRAQQQPMPLVGLLSRAPAAERATAHRWQSVVEFRNGLSQSGYFVDRNVSIEYRWGEEDDDDQLFALAADLVKRRVAVIATLGGTGPLFAAKAATTTIPIVFGMGADPIQLGLVSSLNRPGGNVTGINYMSGELGAKRLGLLHELIPQAERFAMLVNPKTAFVDSEINDAQLAVSAIRRQLEVLGASTAREIDTAFATLVQKGIEALLVNLDNLFMTRRVQITTLAARHAVPAIYPFSQFARVGGLMSYGKQAFWIRRAKLAFTLAASLRVTSRPICQCCVPPNSSLSSTSKPPGRLALRFQRGC
jgi:putative ABC transport system substrate-binding protein